MHSLEEYAKPTLIREGFVEMNEHIKIMFENWCSNNNDKLFPSQKEHIMWIWRNVINHPNDNIPKLVWKLYHVHTIPKTYKLTVTLGNFNLPLGDEIVESSLKMLLHTNRIPLEDVNI